MNRVFKGMNKNILRLFSVILVVIFSALAFTAATAKPAITNDDCMQCHADTTLTTKKKGQTVSLYVDLAKYSRSVHKQAECTSCHSDIKDLPHSEKLKSVECGTCHDVPEKEFSAGIHGKALSKKEPYAPTCSECHGSHSILPPNNPNSLTYKMNIPFLCGKCHKEGAPVARIYNIPEKNILDNYSESIHGEGLYKRGLIVTATCNNCHGNHQILPHFDKHASTSPDNIAKTCQVCHTRIEQVHQKVIRGELWEKKPGAIPACSDCHLSHKIRKAMPAAGLSNPSCLRCHSREMISGIGDKEKVARVVESELQNSAHKNIPCIKCHTDVNPLMERPCVPCGKVDCAACHAQIEREYNDSAHGQAYLQKKPDNPYCTDCHGKHLVLYKKDPNAPVYRANVPALCGKCHGPKGAAASVSKVGQGNVSVDYSTSVHGMGLKKKGLLPAAICTDCHNSHFILSEQDQRSSVSAKNVSTTCGVCHKGIYNAFSKSIHSPTVSTSKKPLPTCATCHSSHAIKLIEQDQFMREVTDQCGSCHKEMGATYLETMHGKAYRLGYLKSAKCSDCHGAHDVLGVNNPNSHVGFNNVVKTCQKCHPDANRRFTGYLTHATHHDKAKYPVLYITFWAMTALLLGTFGFFGLHTLLWLPRSFAYVREKRQMEMKSHKTKYYIRRFTAAERIGHVIVILSFMALALTGMVLKFAGLAWAQLLTNLMGGVVTAGRIHRVAASVMIFFFLYHIYTLLRSKIRNKTPWKEFLFGKNTMLPTAQDVKDFVGTVKWFFGAGPRPQYGHWTYWEKFDYLAVFWGIPVIGLSGLMLWFPEIATQIFPGWFINVATIVHSDEALLAAGFIFTVHFFNTHLRPETFPMDKVIFTGLVPLGEYRIERPRDYEELKEKRRFKKVLVSTEVSPLFVKFAYAFGFFFLAVGIMIVMLIIYSMIFGYQ